MDTAPAGSGPGTWLRNPGQLPGASKHKNLLQTLHAAPQVPDFIFPGKGFGLEPTLSLSPGGALGGP